MSLTHTEFARLMDFQRDTVDYVLERFFGPGPTRRFLVADEVGMGKTLVARGVIAGTVDRLRAPGSKVDRVDILYICSNANIARQNISKLDVIGEGTKPMSTRITLLARHLGDLNQRPAAGGKTVNLISFTPGTSFQKGHTGGRVEERALLAYFTRPLFSSEQRRNAVRKIFRGDVKPANWTYQLRLVENSDPAPDRGIGRAYRQLVREHAVYRKLQRLVAEVATSGRLAKNKEREATQIVGQLRHLLARASVSALEPDLIILDEFQRFRHLLDEQPGSEHTEVAELARDLFTFKDARILLLSATPYKLYTLPEDASFSGDQHYEDLLKTVEFLGYPRGKAVVAGLRTELSGFRDRLIGGGDPTPHRDAAQQVLRSVMSRTERPTLEEANLLAERVGGVSVPQERDLVDFIRARRLARLTDSTMSVEYWKSAPHFLSFMDGYQLSRRVKERFAEQEVQDLARDASVIRSTDISKVRRIDPSNPRLRALEAEVLDSGLHQLLWLPPSMPYHLSGGPFAEVDPIASTKRLIFSSWAAAPSSIAALLSHEADRRLSPTGPGSGTHRLQYALGSNRRPSSPVLLALTVPQPGLAMLTDPLIAARRSPEVVLTAGEVLEQAQRVVDKEIPDGPPGGQPDSWYWYAPLVWTGHIDRYADLYETLSGDEADRRGIPQYLALADEALAGKHALGTPPEDLAEWVALIGMASPANCAWRALRRVAAGHGVFSDAAVLEGAVIIADAFRRLFGRPETARLIHAAGDRDGTYWRRVLEYCFAGNLQAVLDEYLHHLVGNANPTSDNELIDLAKAVADVIAPTAGFVTAFNPVTGEGDIRFNTRFALRFGNARGTLARSDQAVERAGDVQAAFNSPFWPFVLASTSVGQEGVDFHWWCHSLVHWNQPANVVDLEQREGRVHRFKGHAVRKNVAAACRAEALRSEEPDPWAAAFRIATERREPGMNDLWPAWVFPGPASVECWVPYLPLSKDQERERQLRRDRALYRLAFGQPRQEDLLAVLEASGRDPATLQNLRIDLRPPHRRPVPALP